MFNMKTLQPYKSSQSTFLDYVILDSSKLIY